MPKLNDAAMTKIIPGWTTGQYEVPEWKFDGMPALIINHMIVGIVGNGQFSGGPRGQTVEYLASHPYIIENQKKLLAAFREKGYPVIFISVAPNAIGWTPKWGFIYRMVNATSPVGHMENPELRELAQVIPEMGRRPEEPLVIHTGCCLFTGNNLDEMLRHLKVEDLVITGFTAHSTIYNSVIQATDKYFSVVVPRDSSGSPGRDEGNDEFVYNRMMPMYSLVTTTDDVIAHL